jgi:hypothetical protein
MNTEKSQLITTATAATVRARAKISPVGPTTTHLTGSANAPMVAPAKAAGSQLMPQA